MRLFFTPLLLLLFSFHSGIAQQNFVEGYVVTRDADTLRGFINDKNWDQNPLRIEFKKQLRGPSETYTPHQIASFSTRSGDLYQSRIVSVDKTPTRLSELTRSTTPTVVTDTVFLLAVVTGKASLFYLKDEHEKAHFYFGKDGSPLEELIVKKSVQESNGQNVLVTADRFKGQLNAAFQDCPAVKSVIAKVEYKREALQKLFLRYNQCFRAGESAYVSRREGIRISSGVLIGGTLTGLRFNCESPVDLVNSTFSRSLGYTAGLSLDVALPRNRRKWSFYNELKWKTYQTEATYTQVRSANNFYVSNISFNMGYISLVNVVRYRWYPAGKISPFVNAGIFNAVALKSTHRTITESQFYTTRRVTTTKSLEDSRRLEQGLVLGAGVIARRLSGELRYEIGNGLSVYSGLGSITDTFSLLVGYRFN